MLVFKELTDCLYLLLLTVMVIILLQKTLIKNIFFRDLKLKIRTSKLMEEIFMINKLMTQCKLYNEIRKISKRQGDDYTTGCLLDFAYFEKNYRLIAVDLSKQKVLDAHSRAIQQIIFTGKVTALSRVCYNLEK